MTLRSEELEKIIKDVIYSRTYSQYYLSKFGMTQSNISKLRHNKGNIINLRLKTIKQILNAYEYKNKSKNNKQSIEEFLDTIR
ncbi:hypothetical protein DY052_07540 [Apilactobacillus timberlakei]|uniref:hypothetical protein n=1 Tax=Apilactobacillus timberlakei TaxID=2008380 RepID=UPI0011289989|nr:hypothetical protein [Apilactobacillus timberlakei]TPR13706.1 hypothetical protein DY052_07540 [Apilactobacillus timberlakei]